jgi:SAM-dependent methyltransferase
VEPVSIRPDGLHVGACRGCSLLYVADVPDPLSLAAFYRSYGVNRERVPDRVSFAGRLFWWSHPLVLLLEDAVGLAGKSVLEIGCSEGATLERLRARGAQVSGVELDEEAHARLRKRRIPFSTVVEGSGRHDVVLALQVLEHLVEPARLVSDVARVLRDGGIFLLAMPNGGEAARVGPGWIGYRRDLEHLTYFSIGTLSALLSQHGIWVERFWEEGQPRDEVGSRSAAGRFSALRRLFTTLERPFPGAGSFNLVVLARKCASP